MSPIRFASIGLLTVLIALVVGCSNVVTVNGQNINCDDYVSRYANVNVDLSKLKQYQVVIGLSFEQLSKFETLQGDYVLQARRLCQSAPLYHRDPPNGPREWRCRDERLSRSLAQLRVITSALNALKSEKDAVSNAEAMRKTVEHYFTAFMSEAPCSAPPAVRDLAELKSSLDLLHEILKTVIKQEIVNYKESLPLGETGLLTSIIKGLGNAPSFHAKTDLLLAELYYVESLRALENPTAPMPLDLFQEQRLGHYESLSDPSDLPLRNLAANVRRQLTVVRFIADDQTAFRKSLNNALVRSGAEEKRRLVEIAIKAVETDKMVAKTVSIYNLLGTLSISIGDRERALKYYYEGYLLDKEHVPIYDSLSYAMWRLNGDSFTGRQYADTGLKLITELRIRLSDLHQKTLENLKRLKATGSVHAAAIGRYEDEILGFYRSRRPSIAKHLDDMYDRLLTNAAYYRAIEVVDKEEAERMAHEVLHRTPENKTDADYLDLFGFVRLRFAKDVNGIDEAISYFRQARDAAVTQDQRELAERHISLAMRTKDLRRTLAAGLGVE